MKSIVIIGKGPSVGRSTFKYIDSFDEVAVCNYPIYHGYEHLISNHANFHFRTDLAEKTFFNKEFEKKIGISKVIYTGGGSWIRKQFRFKNLDPSTGTLALSYFLARPEYKKISLVGFDLFPKHSSVYYFKPHEIDPCLNYLFDNNTYNRDTFVSNIESGHNHKLTAEFMELIFHRFYNINFELITNYSFNYDGKNTKFL